MKIKELNIVLLLLLLSSGGYSQTEKGTFVLSGKTDLNFLFSNSTISRDSIATNKIKSSQFGFNLGFGYFVADNFIIALSGAYSYTDTKFLPGTMAPRGNENITTTLALIPQVSYYFPLAGKLRPSLSMGAGYLWLRERNSKVSGNDNLVYSLAGPSYNGAARVSYFITGSVAFDLGLQYTHNRLKDKAGRNETQKQNTVAGSFGVSVFF